MSCGGIISVKLLKRPRDNRDCWCCYRQISGPQLRLYGAAGRGDKPYAIYVCPNKECAGIDPKVQKELSRWAL